MASIAILIPPFLVLAPFWLLPASLYVHTEMTAPIYIWALLISLALNKVWRRHRLAQHGFVRQGEGSGRARFADAARRQGAFD